MEMIINQNYIIDEVELVQRKLEKLVEGECSLEITREFINTQPFTIFHFDQLLTEKTEHDKETRIAWLDSGYCHNNEPIFISLINYYGIYCGHFVGTAKFLSQGLINNNGYYREYMQHFEKFKKKYDKKIEQRTQKHIENVLKKQNKVEKGADTNVAKLLKKSGYQLSEESYADTDRQTFNNQIQIQVEMTDVTEEIFNNLLYPSWKSIKGLDRYIKIIGRRIEQLISAGKTEYFVINKIRSVVVNTGLINLFGNDYLVMYRFNQKYGTYVAYQIMSGKGDYLKNDYTKEQASVELKPIQFVEKNDMFFEASIDEFDINQRCLTHIIEDRRNRFPDELQNEPANKISAKLIESLHRGLKIQMRDRSYAKLTYSGKDGKLSWLLPLHINNEFTQEPELVMVIKKEVISMK